MQQKTAAPSSLFTFCDKHLHTFCRLPHILYNAHYYACCILLRNHRRAVRRSYKFLLPGCFLNSLIERRHNMQQSIPYPVEYILPSFLHHLHVCLRKHNDYRLLHILNMHQYNFCKCDTLSFFKNLLFKKIVKR